MNTFFPTTRHALAFAKRFLVIVVAVLIMATGLTITRATPASATATPWSIRLPASSPDAASWSFPTNATCYSSTLCTMSGWYEGTDNHSYGWVSIYDGTKWTQYSVGNTLGTEPDRVGGTELSSVQCVSATFCTASGYYTIGNQIHGMVSVFDGTTWTDYAVGASIEVNMKGSWISNVSCASSTFCMATGTYQDDSYNHLGYVSTWDGTAWTTSLLTPPANSGYTSAGEYPKASCLSTTYCAVALTVTDTNANEYAAIAIYNGSTWTYNVNTSSSASPTIAGFTCLSTTFCALAVMYAGSVSGTYSNIPKVLFWNGSTWNVTAPTPPGITPTSMGGFTCVTSTFCVVTGQESSWHAYGSVWNGSTWTKTVVGASMDAGNNSQLMRVSCSSTSNCYAAGYYSKTVNSQGEAGFYARYDGSSWTATDLADANLYRASGAGAACASSGFCMVYGAMMLGSGRSEHFHAYAYGGFPPTAPSAPSATKATSGDHSAGLTWTAPFSNGSAITGYTVTASPGGATCTTTTALTCTITGLTNDTVYTLSVTATNSIGTSDASTALTTTPAAPPVPAVGWIDDADPFGNGTTPLMGTIECLSTTFCVSGGGLQSGSAVQAVVGFYDGTSWTATQIAQSLNVGNNASVTRVRCLSTTFCVAGGSYTDASNKSRLFVATYDGTSWTATQIASTFTGGMMSWISSISCASTTFCALAGSAYSPQYQPKGFVASFNGTTWTTAATSDLGGGQWTYAFSVECPTTSLCIGLSNVMVMGPSGATNKMVSMTFNGTSWTSTEITQTGYSDITFFSLDCTSATFCATVGVASGNTNPTPVAATFNGTSWTISDVSGLSGVAKGGSSGAGGIVCFSSTNCVASSSVSMGTQASHQVAMKFDGTSWTGSFLGANIDPGNGGMAYGLSCPSATLCFVPGRNVLSDGTSYATMSTLKNGTWTTGALGSTLTGSNSGASSVACPSTTMCIATGNIQPTPTSNAGFISYFTGGAVKPGPVSGASATSGNGSLTVSWNAPTTGDAPTSYTVSVPGQPDCTIDLVANPSAPLSCTFTGLTNGTSYTATIVASNAKGNATGVTASATPATAPSAPTGVTTSAGNGSVTVSWTAPSATGGSAITSYTVTASPGGATCTVNAPATSCTVSGLTNGTNYTFAVTATNGAGTSTSSGTASTSPQATAPGAPTNVAATGNDGQADVTWTAPTNDGGDAIDGYIVTASPGGATCTAVAPATTCTIAGLTNGTEYTFSVVATNNAGNSASSTPSNAVTPGAAPGTPDYVQATPGNHSTQINWAAPSTGPAPTRYVVTMQPGGTTCTVDLVANPSAPLSCNFTGLTNGTRYTFTVTAFLANGNSTSDTISTVVNPGPLKPTAPRVIVFHGDPKGVTVVSWKVSASNGGSAIIKYIATVTGPRYAKSCTVNMAANPRAALKCTFTGLKPKRFYSYRVVAVNAVGQTASAKAKRAIDTSVRMVSFARGKVTMWSGLYRQAFITASYIKRFKYTKVVLTGYTNPGGTLASRTSFTQARALTVANYLTRQLRTLGVTGVTIIANGTGASIHKNPNAAQRRLNRSVATLLTYK